MRNPTPAPFGYQNATSARHQMLVRRDLDGAWQMLDILVIESISEVGVVG